MSISQLTDLPCGVVLYYHNQRQNSVGSFCARGHDLVGNSLTIDTPLRIASNTKPFTAAAILRLAEMGALFIEDSISHYISPKFSQLLAQKYDIDAITIAHLLSHSSGLLDHADANYLKDVLKQPDYQWSRLEQIERYVQQDFPLFGPSEAFIYSDTGYILLGDIIERATRLPLGEAVRELLRFDEIGLKTAYWEYLEAPTTTEPRARQYLGKLDCTDVHPSMDTYGGGGLVMSSKQMALFFEALFTGKIFTSPETLNTMLRMGTHEGAEHYRLGIMAKKVNGITLYFHLGFWGSVAYYEPETQTCVAGFVDNRDERGMLINAVESQLTAQ
ncbi:serine hydrolase domain-containing protein [Providencia rustigianii]|uniref:serine hydrolase domain-containing protein n=1 Tax=Providencia rustigianii TaxID=158850 RepID=UPI000D9E3286|nr:serine hydrolase domain-containing protein [Providencia rustigianii]SPY76222.1 D-alanyl-D-alanine carboxypeptidase precursor [Providencia rustigianii]